MQNHRDRFIVVDRLSNGILCESATPSVAHSVSMGFINSSVKILPNSLPWAHDRYCHDYNSINDHYEFRKMSIFPLSEELISQDYIKMRKLALARNTAHQSWEVKCKQFLHNKNHDYHGLSLLSGYLYNELDKCDPRNNNYTPAIHEWATISEVPVDVAYQELKIKSQSIGLQYLRNHAIYHKYVILINKCQEKSQFQKIIDSGLDLLVVGRSLI